MPWERGHSVDIGKPIQVTEIAADTSPARAKDVALVAYVGASGQ